MRFPSHGLIAFISIWAIVFAVPSLRHQMLDGRTPPSQLLTQRKLPDLQGALKEEPNDPFLLSQQLQENQGPYKSIDVIVREPSQGKADPKFYAAYDALIAKAPNNLALRRNRLRLSTRHDLTVEPHYMKNWRILAAHEHYSVPPDAPPGMSPQELEKVVTLAHQSSKIAPDDAFFPFVEAIALDGLGKEQESAQALKRAGRCHDFNDGAVDETRQRIAYFQKRGEMEWDDKLLMNASQLFPHFAQMRSLAREVSYSGVDEYKAGRKDLAWERWDAELKASTAMRDAGLSSSHSSLIGILVSEACSAITWSAVATSISGYKPESKYSDDPAVQFKNNELKQIERVKRFEQLARRDGHAALADFSHRQFQSILARRRANFVSNSKSDLVDDGIGWQAQSARVESQVSELGWPLFVTAWLCALGWPLSWFATRGGRETGASQGLIWGFTVLFASFWIGVLILLLSHTISGNYWLLTSLVGGNSPDSVKFGRMDWLRTPLPFWGITSSVLLIIYNLSRKLARHPKVGKQRSRYSARITAPMSAWILTLAFSAALWFDGAYVLEAKSQVYSLMPLWLIAQAVALYMTWKAQNSNSGTDTFWMPFAWSTALGLASSILIGRPMPSDNAVFVACGLGVIAVAIFTVQMVRSWRGREAFMKYLSANADVFGRVMANMGLVLTLAYVVATATLWPTRTMLERNVEQYLQQGEVPWMREHKLYGIQAIK